MKRPLVIGHRGAPTFFPENTLASFEHAISLGADMVELDLRESLDGHLVVIHDEHVSRVSSGEGLVSEMNLSELKSLDFGSGATIPTLDEVLDLCRNRCFVNIEIKVLDIERQAINIVRSKFALTDVLFSSFLHETLIEVKEVDQFAETAILYGDPMENPSAYAVDLGASAINPFFIYLDESLIANAHAEGLKVYPWTVNDEDVMQDFVKMGVDGIITDEPKRFRRVVDTVLH